MSKTKLSLLFVLLLAIIAIIWWLPPDLLTLENLKARQADIELYRSKHPVLAVLIYCGVYIAFTALSIPGAVFLTLIGGAIFGLFYGTIWISVSSTTGATLAFLMSRFFFQQAVKEKFGDRLNSIEENLRKDGAFYLFSMRLVPAIPFFIINLVMGLTPIKTLHYVLASWSGMLAGTIVYVNAGTQLSKLESLSGILSPPIVFSFLLLASFPYIARKLLSLKKK
ncbi:MAG: TVP38/TMEM64 family protein [Proteobacteria bacterium]|nr:TVP38/TMEM64 family protein [Pseudomonadota bacterium]